MKSEIRSDSRALTLGVFVVKLGLVLIFCHARGLQGAAIVTAIAVGNGHSLLIKSDGSLWAMGYNGSGALGDGTLNNASRPKQIVANGVIAAAAGYNQSLFLKSDGSLWAMGANTYGQLGDGTVNNTNRPEQVLASGVAAIACGAYHSLLMKSDGSLWAMGLNVYGELGDGTTNNTSMPKQIVPGGVVAIAAGWLHSLFVKSDGSLWAMGQNLYGQLGDGTTNQVNTPEQIVASGVTAVAAEGWHSLFLKSDGSLWSMGYNVYGALGDGTINNAYRPEQIVASNVTKIASGQLHSLFVKSDGTLWTMGHNNNGELGDEYFGAHNDDTYSPVQILDYSRNLLPFTNVVAVAGGGQHSLFLEADGSLWGMGQHAWLGDGFTGTYYYGGNNVKPYSNYAEQILPPQPPVLTVLRSASNTLQFNATCAFGGNFYLLTSTNAAQPLSQWSPIWTNSVVTRSNNNFSVTLTNSLDPGSGGRFYILQGQ